MNQKQIVKGAVLVTLADRNYLEQAKQVFASAYFNAGWKGDYLLLAHEIPEKDLQWFRQKGVLIYHCQRIFNPKIAGAHPAILSKLYLFEDYFKKWQTIIYYDADVIIRSSLDFLIGLKGFASVNNVNNDRLSREIISLKRASLRGINKNLYLNLKKELSIKYHLDNVVFGAGMMVFNSALINKNLRENLKNLISKYGPIGDNVDQFILNLYFYHRWQKLPPVYDIYLMQNKNQWRLKNAKIKGIVLHFCGSEKPWLRNHYFYREWQTNLTKADLVNLANIPKGKTWSRSEIKIYSFYLKVREKFFNLFLTTAFYFRVMFFVERNFPFFFRLLKKTKRILKDSFNF